MLLCTVLIHTVTLSKDGYNEVPSNDMVSFYWWFWGCQFLIFIGLIEYALALAWVQFVIDKKIANQNQKVVYRLFTFHSNKLLPGKS